MLSYMLKYLVLCDLITHLESHGHHHNEDKDQFHHKDSIKVVCTLKGPISIYFCFH